MWILLCAALGQDQIRDLLEQLGDDSPRLRDAAEARLVEMGPEAEAAVRETLESTTDAEVKERAARIARLIPFARTLGRGAARDFIEARGVREKLKILAGRPDAPIEEAVALRIADELLRLVGGWESKRELIYAIGSDRVRMAYPVLIRLLQDPHVLVRRSAAEILIVLRMKNHADEVARLLRHADASIRRLSLDVLIKLEARDCVPQVVERLEDTDPGVRLSALVALNLFKASDRAAAVVGRLADSDPVVRDQAATVLTQLDAKACAAQIADLLRSEDGDVRMNAAEVLGELGVREHVRSISALLDDPRTDVRQKAVRILASWGASGYSKKISVMLADPDVNLRRHAAFALGAFKDRETLGALKKALEAESDEFTRGTVQFAIDSIESAR